MSIKMLPLEILETVFQNADSQDIPKFRFVCNTFNSVIKQNYVYLPRQAYLTKIFMKSGEVFVSHLKSGNASGCEQKLFDFEFKHWREIAIVDLEIADFTNSECSKEALQTIINQLYKTKQHELRKVTFSNINLDENHTEEILELIQIAFHQCENVLIQNCQLPIIIDDNLIASSSFDHFRWVTSNAKNQLPSDKILRKLQHDMRKALNQRSFLAEMTSVDVGSACNFIEEWLRLPIAYFFNLSFHDCDDMWKTRFLNECEKRKLTHNYMEFQSKTHADAHVKVSFSQDARTCCIWPILDVPARTTGQTVCYARYFRDF
ncbi:unnamed protein product [Caenorhabditis angaria]|uniref:F-box domain-containing protein n=1 Tax=Caenorhabditis angaria TaxID=860376 RepID=A0A9P1IZR9_9PELO|nr:unnamed protein product [Caenorhabditis angaria]